MDMEYVVMGRDEWLRNCRADQNPTKW